MLFQNLLGFPQILDGILLLEVPQRDMCHPVRAEGEERVLGQLFDSPPGKGVYLLVFRFFLVPAVITSHVVNGDEHRNGDIEFAEDVLAEGEEAVVGVVKGKRGEPRVGMAFAHVSVHIGELPMLFHKTELPLEIFGGDGVETGFFIDVMVHQDHRWGISKKEKSGRERT